MSLFQEIKNLLFVQESPVAAETKALVGTDGIGRTNPLNYMMVMNNSAARILSGNEAQLNHIFLTILGRIQVTAQSIPWNAYKLAQDENAAKVPNHPLGNLLYRPNPKQSWNEFISQYLGHYISTGNAFILAVKNDTGLNRGQVQQLWVMPTTTEIVVGTSWMAEVKGYRIALQNGGYDTFAPEDVLHLKKYNPFCSAYGLSPLKAGALALTSIDSAMRQRIKQLDNGGPRTVFFNASDDAEGLTETQESATANKLKNSTKPVYIDYKVGTTTIGLSPVDLDLLNALQADAAMVADLLGYPSILLGGNNPGTFNNRGEANKELYNNCVIPHLVELRDGLNFKFGAAYKDKVYMDMDTSNIDVLKPNLSDLVSTAASADFLTINEKRKMAGYPSIDGGDGFLRSAAIEYLATVDEVSATPADAYAANDSNVPEE